MNREEVRSSSPRHGYDVIVRNVSTDEDFPYLLSTPDRLSPSRGLDQLSQDVLDATDAVSSFLERSPGRKLLVISPKSRQHSPVQIQSFDFENPLGTLSGQQIIMLGHHSKVSLAEQAVVSKLRIQTLKVCFRFMKALKHWKRRLVSKVFLRIRKWAVANQYLKASEHKAHQKEVLEQRTNSKVLVSHHTASSRARTEKKENPVKTPAKTTSIKTPAKPSFRPASFNPMLQIQTKFPTTPTNTKKPMNSPKKGSPTRQASVQYLNSKYFQSLKPAKTALSSSGSDSRSRSTTPTPLITNVSSLASHRFYHRSRASRDPAATTTGASALTVSTSSAATAAEPGFDHKPLATTTLSSSTDAAILALRTRVFANSPDRSPVPTTQTDSPSGNSVTSEHAPTETPLSTTPDRQPLIVRRSFLEAFQDSRKPSPTPASVVQRTPVTRPHLFGTMTAPEMSPLTPLRTAPHSVSSSSSVDRSLLFAPSAEKVDSLTAHRSPSSPSAAEIAYARSRGNHSVVSVLSGSSLTPSRSPEQRAEPVAVVLPVLPRVGKLQAVLSQHRSRSLSRRALPGTSGDQQSTSDFTANAANEVVVNANFKEPTIIERPGDRIQTLQATENYKETEKIEQEEEIDAELIIISHADKRTDEVAVAATVPVIVEFSKHFKYLAFRKLQHKIFLLQEQQTKELRATLPAMEYHINARLRRAFHTLRMHRVKARELDHRSQAYHAHVRLLKTFRTLRRQYLEAKISRYRSYDSAINIDNFALMKAFWRLKKNVTHRHQSWFVEQRGVKYHRLLRLSQALSSLTQFAAYGNVVYEGDAGSIQDIQSIDNEASEVFKTAALLVQGLGATDGDFNFDSSDSEFESQIDDHERSYLPQGFEKQASEDDHSEYEHHGQDEVEVQELTQWEDQHGDTHSESSAEHEAFEIGAIAELGLRSSDNSPSPRGGTVDLSHFMHVAHGPPLAPSHTYPPYEPHQVDIRHQISRSRSDEFPGVSGIDMWDWQDLHNVSREFISDSECDSSREAIEDATARTRFSPLSPLLSQSVLPRMFETAPALPAGVVSVLTGVPVSSPAAQQVGTPNLKMLRRMSNRSLSISPIYSADLSPLSPLPPLSPLKPENAVLSCEHKQEKEDDVQRGECLENIQDHDENSDISLFLSDDSEDADDDHENWPPPPLNHENTYHDDFSSQGRHRMHLEESTISIQASPIPTFSRSVTSVSDATIPHKLAPVPVNVNGFAHIEERRSVELDLPPLPSSPCPSDEDVDEMRDVEEKGGKEESGVESAHLSGYISHSSHSSHSDDELQYEHESHSLGSFYSTDSEETDQISVLSAPSWTAPPPPPTPPARSIDIGASLAEADVYYRRTKLAQGLYAFNQWVVRSQTILTMNDILYEFQALRKLRRGLKTLRNVAML